MRSRRLIGAGSEEGGALSRRFCCEVGCQAAANQARGWRQVGVARSRASASRTAAAGGEGEGEEGARRRGEVEPWVGPSQAGPGRDATEKALGGGRLGPVLRGVGGLGKAERPTSASGGRDRRGGPRGKILGGGRKESRGSAGGGDEWGLLKQEGSDRMGILIAEREKGGLRGSGEAGPKLGSPGDRLCTHRQQGKGGENGELEADLGNPGERLGGADRRLHGVAF